MYENRPDTDMENTDGIFSDNPVRPLSIQNHPIIRKLPAAGLLKLSQ